MYDEENKNLSENPDMENETGADVRDTENAGAEGKDSTAAQPESGTTGSQYRYSGPFYQDTDYQRTESRNTESSFQGSVSKKQKKKKNFGRTIAKTVCIALVFGVVAGAAFQGTNFVGQKLFGDKVTAPVSQDASADTAAPEVGTVQPQTRNSGSEDSAASVSAIVKQCMPSLVAITNVSVKEVQNYWGFGWYSQPQQQESTSTGTGIIIGQNDSELLIVTNNHVITGATNLSVVFSVDEGKDGTTPVEAQIKGSDATKDVGVIAVKLSDIPAETMSAIKTATIGDSSQMQVGDQVIAIGNALGYGQSVTKGIVSALDREVTLQNDDGSTISNKLIQTDAAINPGNSGGALLNMKGEVIGINSNKIGGTAVEGMGYAIPITSASPIIADLMERQTRTKVAEDEVGYIGISLQEVTSQISQMYNMPEGIYVVSVEEGSAAANAGIMKGDIITKFDGSSISSYSDLQKMLQYYAAGDSATITVERPQNGEYVSVELNLTLGSRPADKK